MPTVPSATRFLPLLLLSPLTLATPTLDGDLNDPEWGEAQTLNAFVQTQPYNLTPATLATKALVLSRPDGLYIGFDNAQAPASLRADRHARDAEQSEADAVTAVVDFDGSGRNAYFFTVSLGNSVKDGTITNENYVSRDWDGDWQSATASNAQGWSAELFIPWSAVPLPTVDGQNRAIRAALSRKFTGGNQQFGYPAASWERASYLSDLAPLSIANQASTGRFDFLPYATASYDRVNRQEQTRTGFDLIWKPNGSDQFTMTLNPDFGQVESDELVVNFSAQESFFSEKRPFFTENHALFELTGPGSLSLVHTRRIGAGPGAGSEGATDILAAGKYSHVSQDWDAGVFFALEDDTRQVEGRDYLALRSVHKFGDFSLGYLGTFVDRPALDRFAQVHTIDGQLKAGDWQWSGMVLGSDIDVAGDTTNGYGTVHTLRHKVSERITDDLRVMHFDPDLQIRDLGFVERVDMDRVRLERTISFADFAADSLTLGRDISVAVRTNRNTDGLKLFDDFYLDWNEKLRSGRSLAFNLRGFSRGHDDLTTRGHGVFETDSVMGLFAGWFGNEDGQFRIHHEVWTEEDRFGEPSYSVHTHPGWVFNERFNTRIGFIYTVSDDWLLWRVDPVTEEGRLTNYSREQGSLRWDLNLNIGDDQELRLGWQWLALKADAQHDYAIDDQKLVRGAASTDDFSVSDLALQLRYTWRIQGLSNLYVVYSRGGAIQPEHEEDADQGLDSVLGQSLDNPTTEMVLVKLRWQF